MLFLQILSLVIIFFLYSEYRPTSGTENVIITGNLNKSVFLVDFIRHCMTYKVFLVDYIFLVAMVVYSFYSINYLET